MVGHEEKNNVILLFPSKGGGQQATAGQFQPVIERSPHEPGIRQCIPRCLQIQIDTHTRSVVCRKCGKAHDPFDWLQTASQWEKNIFDSTHAANQELQAKRKALDELQRAEANTRSRLSRLRQKLVELRGEVANVTSVASAKEQIALFLKEEI